MVRFPNTTKRSIVSIVCRICVLAANLAASSKFLFSNRFANSPVSSFLLAFIRLLGFGATQSQNSAMVPFSFRMAGRTKLDPSPTRSVAFREVLQYIFNGKVDGKISNPSQPLSWLFFCTSKSILLLQFRSLPCQCLWSKIGWTPGWRKLGWMIFLCCGFHKIED